MTVANGHGLNMGVDLISHTQLSAPMNRYQMATVMWNLTLLNGDRLPADTSAIQAKIPDFNSIPSKYRDAVMMVVNAGLITGVDTAGTFAGNGLMTRAQAATVLCRLADYLGGTKPPVAESPVPSMPTTPATPAQPESSSPVGTLSDSPVTLSYETHRPVWDYWSNAPANVRDITDKDAFNAAVQTLKDKDLIRANVVTVNGVGSNAPNYNYAVSCRTNSNEQLNVNLAVSGLSASGSNFGTSTTSVGGEMLNFVKAWGPVSTTSVIDPILNAMPRGLSDREKSEWILEAVWSRFEYVVNAEANWTTLAQGKNQMDCNGYVNAAMALYARAGMYAFSAGSATHAWIMLHLQDEGQWVFVEATETRNGYTPSVSARYAHHDESYSLQKYSQPLTKSYLIAKVLVAAATGQIQPVGDGD